MATIRKYYDGEDSFFSNVLEIEDILRVEPGEDIWGPKPDYEKIFGYPKEDAFIMAKLMIIDYFAMLFKDLVYNFCQVTLPTSRDIGTTNILVKTFDIDGVNIETDNKISFPVFMITKYQDFVKRSKRNPVIKLNIKYLRVIRENNKKKLFYLSARRT